MNRLYAQGDILIERISERAETDQTSSSTKVSNVILAEGELTGHQHRVLGSVTLYRDDALARDFPPGLYLAHLRVDGATARVEHEEHAPIILESGTYCVRRQRQLEPTDVGFQADFGIVED